MAENIKKNGKLGMCQVCDENEAKFKCPRCELCSCSLLCVRKHKTENNCNGVRDRLKMMPKENMDNFTLLSDYRFLEEIDHKLEDELRNPLRRSVLKGKESFTELPYHLRRWHVKLVFPQADLSFTEESVDEDTLLINILKKYMEPPNRLDDKNSELSEEELLKLSYYQSASYNRTVVLFKSKLCRYDKRFIEMKLSKSLKDNLCNRKIVEYPVFYVVLKDHLDSYVEMDSESESEIEDPDKGTTEQTTEPSALAQDFKNKLKVNTKNNDGSQKLSYFEAFSDSSDLSD
ncbi:Box C/D snoRNA protein 1 [Armadillidium nasatum]|uniref:Box C/D snoRNA protein 1 n=1 Tax=Armadillidium nasatum TaxID=96803 RepID=A0A5N5THD8_9CRUS|nr:Box C/D snoRNA protein 1 [Armadillidium nasatum]